MQETVQVNLRLPPALAREVAERSRETGVTRNQTYIQLLAAALGHDEQQRLNDVAPETASKRRLRAIVTKW